jgi:3-oxoacyl-[acyl-carrier-protein] synthase-3
MLNIKISNIEVYRGLDIVSNDYYIEHFKKYGKDIKHFLTDIIGRNNRYLIDPDKENSLTMATEATRKVLAEANLTGKDLDMIVYSSVLPEYVAPPSSIYLHSIIGGKHDCICYDINANCVGMTLSLSQICSLMTINSNIKRTLLIGSDYVNPLLNHENEFCYGHYGDAACAIILEKADESCGILGTKCYVNSIEHENVTFPACGFTKAIKSGNLSQYLMDWKPFEPATTEIGVENMKLLLKENNFTNDDVKMFCLSQYAIAMVNNIRELLEIDKEKSLYIGDEYGYTATSSPFIALYESIKRGLIKRGDYIMFWTVGVGTQNAAVLYKY